MNRALQSSAASSEQSERSFDPSDLLTQTDVCRRLGISDDTLRRWRKRGVLPEAIDLPGRPRWRRDVFEAWLRERDGNPRRRRHFGTARVA